MIRRADGNFESKKLDATGGPPKVKGREKAPETSKTSPKSDPLRAVRQFAGDFFGNRVKAGKTDPRVAELALQKLDKGINYKGPDGDVTPLGNV